MAYLLLIIFAAMTDQPLAAHPAFEEAGIMRPAYAIELRAVRKLEPG